MSEARMIVYSLWVEVRDYALLWQLPELQLRCAIQVVYMYPLKSTPVTCDGIHAAGGI